jgi:hypothetical protein
LQQPWLGVAPPPHHQLEHADLQWCITAPASTLHVPASAAAASSSSSATAIMATALLLMLTSFLPAIIVGS